MDVANINSIGHNALLESGEEPATLTAFAARDYILPKFCQISNWQKSRQLAKISPSDLAFCTHAS
jgi:hypothetical protein